MKNPDRYAAILRLRQRAEDREAQELVKIRGHIQQAQRQRTSLELARQATLEKAGENLQQHFDASDIRGYYQYERHVMHLRDQKDAEIREMQQKESAQRARLETATKARRIVEKLHGRRWDRYREYLRKEEQKFMDETAIMYAARAARSPHAPDEWGDETLW